MFLKNKNIIFKIRRSQVTDYAALIKVFVCCFTSQLTAMVMSGRSVHLTTLFLGRLEQAVNQYFMHILLLVTDNIPSLINQQKGGD